MKNNLNDVYSVINEDLSREWLELSSRVRHLSQEIHAKAEDTPLAVDSAVLVSEATRLCDHLERMHRDVERLLENLDVPFAERNSSKDLLELDEVQLAAIKIHREGHEKSTSVKEVIKALFMWQDDPVERARTDKMR